MFVKIFLFIVMTFLSFKSISTNKIEPMGNRAIQVSASNCVLSIAETHFVNGSILAIIQSGLGTTTNLNLTQTTYNMILHNLMLSSRWSIMIKKSNIYFEYEAHSIEKVHNYILFMKTEYDCITILNMLVKTSSWNPHALFFIYVDGQVQNWEDFVTYVLAQFWKYFVINITISVPDKSLKFLKLLTWMPFDAGHCGKEHSQFIEIARCQDSQIIPLGVDVFPEKVPIDFNKCPVQIVTTTWPPFILSVHLNNHTNTDRKIDGGIEINAITTISEKMNFLPVLYFDDKNKWGEIFENGSSIGMIGTLLRAEADIAIGTITPRQQLHAVFDFSIQYLQDETTWVVPFLEPFPHWIGLIKLFQPIVWYASILTYVVMCATIWVLGTSTVGERKTFVHLPNIVLLVARIMIGNCPPTFPRSTRMQIVITMWSIFCLIWYSAYTTSLISMITSPLYGENLNSIEDILKSNISLGMPREIINYFQMEQYSSDRIASEILRRYELCESTTQCLHRAATDKNFATAVSRKYYEFVKNDYVDENGKPSIRTFDQNIVSPPIEMIMRKGFPLLSRINIMLLQIIEAGLIDFWTRSLSDETTAITARISLFDINSNDRPLQFTHLQGAFLIQIIGLTVAGITFLYEICFGPWKTSLLQNIT